MKKTLISVLILAVLSFAPSLSFAQKAMMKEEGKASEQEKPVGERMPMKHGMKDGMCPLCSMTMGSMMKREVVASGDGGVIILSGNKLSKYDKDLNLVKEIELPNPMDTMGEKMADMKKMCPLCQKKMMQISDSDSKMTDTEKK